MWPPLSESLLGFAMDFLMRMPDLATVDATVTVVAWLKDPGEHVRRGEPLLEVETDKAILPVESPVVGVLCEITVVAGAEVEAGQVIARLTVEEHSGASPSGPGVALRSRSELRRRGKRRWRRARLLFP